jgi:hypothetical protein
MFSLLLYEKAVLLPVAPKKTAEHLCKGCPFTTVVWNYVHQGEDVPTPGRDGQSFPSISEWWDEMITGKPKKERLLYVFWTAWKERNQRIFMGHRLTYTEIASIAKEDIL